MLKNSKLALAATIVASNLYALAQAVTIPVQEDVMTSAFFSGPNFVRGYAGEVPARNVHRVSSDDAFGTGPETVYLAFDPAEFVGFSAPVPRAILTMQSADGGFGANAGPGEPFKVSAHGVDADPFTEISDDANLGGAISWLDFFNNNILPAEASASTDVDDFGSVAFDVTSVVNDWIAGTNQVFVLAITGKNDLQVGDGFLHGFLNNSENPGSTILTIVPEPTTCLLGAMAVVSLVTSRRGYRDERR